MAEEYKAAIVRRMMKPLYIVKMKISSQAVSYLKRFPLLGIVLDEGKSEIRDMVIENYLLRYKIDANNQIIHILRIWNGKEDLLSRRP